jgi:hypothetical protein
LGLTGELVDVLRLQVGGVLDLERRPTDLVHDQAAFSGIDK